jgi:tetratricopeptide (TPR) repeat protein
MAFAFSVPFWSSATRLHFQTFDVLLVLIAVRGLQLHAMAPSLVRAVAVALVCGAGCVESPVFLTLSPIFLAVLVLTRMRAEEPWEWHALACLVAAVAAAGGAAALLWDLRSIAAGESLALRTVLSELARTHLAVLRSALPPHGWIWVLLLVFAPFAAMFLAARRAFGESSGSLFVLHILATVTSGLALFGVPVLFWGAARGAEHFPVMAALTVAATAGYLAAYWNLLGVPRDQPDEDLAESTRWSDRVRAWMGACLGWPLAASVVVAAVLNLGVSNGRNGWFADALAGDVLDRLGGRTWVASDGMLDSHLLILARERRVEIQLVSLSQGKGRDQQRHLERIVDTSSVFAGRRERMRNALALGPLEFLQEWLTTDPVAGSRLAVLGVPEIWTRAGYRAMPDGFVFCGTRELASQRGRDLVGPVRAYWARMARQLAPETGPQSARSRFRGVLRRQKTGEVEDLVLPALIKAAGSRDYVLVHLVRASLLRTREPIDFAGVRNALLRAMKIRPDLWSVRDDLLHLDLLYGTLELRERDATDALRAAPDHPVANYLLATVRLARGELQAAEDLLRRSLAASPSTPAYNDLAETLRRQGRLADAASAARAALARDGKAHIAWDTLGNVLLDGGRVAEAAQAIEQALTLGANDPRLHVSLVRVRLAQGRREEARAILNRNLLHAATLPESLRREVDTLTRQVNSHE